MRKTSPSLATAPASPDGDPSENAPWPRGRNAERDEMLRRLNGSPNYNYLNILKRQQEPRVFSPERETASALTHGSVEPIMVFAAAKHHLPLTGPSAQSLVDELAPYLIEGELSVVAAVIAELRSKLDGSAVPADSHAQITDAESCVYVAEAKVCSILDEFEHAELEEPGERSLVVSGTTLGVNWHDLEVGDLVVCLVRGWSATQVLFGKMIARPALSDEG